MRRAQSVRHYGRPSLALGADDLGVLREGDESNEDILRRQLLDKDRENDKVTSMRLLFPSTSHASSSATNSSADPSSTSVTAAAFGEYPSTRKGIQKPRVTVAGNPEGERTMYGRSREVSIIIYVHCISYIYLQR